MKQKEEILKAISTIKIDCTDFNHCVEDSPLTYSSKTYEVGSKHYLISIDITECLRWNGWEDTELEYLEINDLTVERESGRNVNIDYITDDEILNAINY